MDITNQKLLQHLQTMENHKENYDHIELSAEEVEAAIWKARKAKDTAIREKEYWERVSKPKQFPVYDKQQLADVTVRNIKNIIPDFIFDDNNKDIFARLCYYFSNDPLYEELPGSYSLKKGLALIGPVGCGKTTLMRAFCVNQRSSYIVTSCRQVAGDYSSKDAGGDLAIQKYSGLVEVVPNDFWGQRFIGRCFDDLGTENAKKHFGNESNVMEEIFLNRYDSQSLIGKTHFTSNLTAKEIEELYGTRVLSRIREMFNWHTFSPASEDRRK